MTKIPAKLVSLSLLELKYFVLSLIYLPLIGIVLRKHGFNKTTTWIEQRYSQNHTKVKTDNQDLKEASQIGRMVCAAAHHGPFKAKCLTRALLIFFFLQRRGIESKIIFGTNSLDAERFEAHAWIEYMGFPIGEQADIRKKFTVFQ